MLRFLLADSARDGEILAAAREIAAQILEKDPGLAMPEHLRLRQYLASEGKDASFEVITRKNYLDFLKPG